MYSTDHKQLNARTRTTRVGLVSAREILARTRERALRAREYYY